MLRESEIRFWSYVNKTDSCWLWTGGLSSNGYGHFTVLKPQRKAYRAHRFVYESIYGEIPAGRFVCHKCDTPACVRPDHLFLGTPQDNMDDKIRKGRQLCGEQCNKKLTWAKVREIRAALHAGEKATTIALRYRVHYSLVYRIQKNVIWIEKEN
jgi:flavin-binding protein dodecin